jgi:hypothetical protein
MWRRVVDASACWKRSKMLAVADHHPGERRVPLEAHLDAAAGPA